MRKVDMADIVYLKARLILDTKAGHTGEVKPSAAFTEWAKNSETAQASFEAADNGTKEVMNLAASLGDKERAELFKKLQRDVQALEYENQRLEGEGVKPNKELKARMDKDPGAEWEFLRCNDEAREILNMLALMPEDIWRSVYDAYQFPEDAKA